MTSTVIVVFSVNAEPALAERIVEERLDAVRILQENDSSDVGRGTLDPINSYAVVPATTLLAEAL